MEGIIKSNPKETLAGSCGKIWSAVKFLLGRWFSVLTKRTTFEIRGSQRSSKSRFETALRLKPVPTVVKLSRNWKRQFPKPPENKNRFCLTRIPFRGTYLKYAETIIFYSLSELFSSVGASVGVSTGASVVD